MPLKRKFPDAPIVAVSGLVLNARGEFLAVKRGTPPGVGEWSLPGGAVHLGEPVREAVAREIAEECNIQVAVEEVLGVFDRIFRNPTGQVEYHYVLISFLCRFEKGNPQARSDAQVVRWMTLDDIDSFNWTIGVKEFLQKTLKTK